MKGKEPYPTLYKAAFEINYKGDFALRYFYLTYFYLTFINNLKSTVYFYITYSDRTLTIVNLYTVLPEYRMMLRACDDRVLN